MSIDPETAAVLKLAGIGPRWHNVQLSDMGEAGNKIKSQIGGIIDHRRITRNIFLLGHNHYSLAMVTARALVLSDVGVKIGSPVQLVAHMERGDVDPETWVMILAGDSEKDSPLTPRERAEVEDYILTDYVDNNRGIVVQGTQPEAWWSNTFISQLRNDYLPYFQDIK